MDMDTDLEMLLSLWHLHLLNEDFLRDHEGEQFYSAEREQFYSAEREQFYSAIQSFNANQRDFMNARILKELREDLQALGLADINIKYKLKLVHDLKRNPSYMDEWRLMGNEDRINRVRLYTESDIL